MPAIVLPGVMFGNAASVSWYRFPATVTASSSAAGYPAINVTDPATWSSWRKVGNGGWLQFDFGQVRTVNSLGISAHNMATSGTSFTLQYSSNATTWNTVTTYAPVTDDDIYIIFPNVVERYWRLLFTGPAANLGVVVISGRLQFLHAPISGYTPLHHARKYRKLFNDSIDGQFLSNRVMSVGAETTVDLGFYERDWLEANIRTFEAHYNQGGMFFYAGCPEKYPLDMGYCRAGGEDETMAIEWVEGDKMSNLSFGIRSYVG